MNLISTGVISNAHRIPRGSDSDSDSDSESFRGSIATALIYADARIDLSSINGNTPILSLGKTLVELIISNEYGTFLHPAAIPASITCFPMLKKLDFDQFTTSDQILYVYTKFPDNNLSVGFEPLNLLDLCSNSPESHERFSSFFSAIEDFDYNLSLNIGSDYTSDLFFQRCARNKSVSAHVKSLTLTDYRLYDYALINQFTRLETIVIQAKYPPLILTAELVQEMGLRERQLSVIEIEFRDFTPEGIQSLAHAISDHPLNRVSIAFNGIGPKQVDLSDFIPFLDLNWNCSGDYGEREDINLDINLRPDEPNSISFIGAEQFESAIQTSKSFIGASLYAKTNDTNSIVLSAGDETRSIQYHLQMQEQTKLNPHTKLIFDIIH